MSEPMLQGTGCSMHEPYALQVLGPDMEPEFPDRCVVIIEPTQECRSGMYVFAEVEGVRWFRQYKRHADGREQLLALNERFPTIELTGLERGKNAGPLRGQNIDFTAHAFGDLIKEVDLKPLCPAGQVREGMGGEGAVDSGLEFFRGARLRR
mgnify:CR=1 FL=1